MIDWQNIDHVLFDMDGTLLDLYFDNYFWQQHVIQRYAEEHEVDEVTIRPKLLQRMNETRGSLDWYCLDFWSREFKLDILALKKEVDHLIAVHQHAEEFLQSLQGWRTMSLVTNAHPDALKLKLERTGIEAYFDHVLSSHEFKTAKEESGFWEMLQQRLSFDPARTLLVEDSLSILSTAKNFGIAHLLAVKKPDSRTAATEVNTFPSINDFGELLPLNKSH